MTSQRPQIDLIINSFNGSSSEFSDSLEIVEFFKNKKYKLSTVIDINQELNFDKEKKDVIIVLIEEKLMKAILKFFLGQESIDLEKMDLYMIKHIFVIYIIRNLILNIKVI